MRKKKARRARMATVRAQRSEVHGFLDTVTLTAYINDREDYDRKIVIELTSKGAREVAAALLEEAEKAEKAAQAARDARTRGPMEP
ncbi:hypothetical protein [Streptomyces alkaliterrae]|uniref:Uncharacterized protein n=1 Tax=Streptomyces alkaliterrae TaxID=2213162 RepID=A0A5P0YJ94_9ACTN|nr:hypothetical protein [Streptomyces alkaliterrae]MBB1251855.1 hypothetical protein [Streptomyces alkaliterrae]MBB1259314.1 hypothetical protein [Streptomyces alkaliterrae]MQS00308.1 hypothetical protein [Streptomyces alkaliterrae]